METTKKCKCGNTHLVLLRTHNLKVCTNCNKLIPWYLGEGQAPLGYKKGKKDEAK